jgi:phosphatidylglycerophosphatase A
MIRRLWMTGLGLGYAPVASGTFGSAGAIAIAMAVWLAARSITGDVAPAVLSACWIVLTLLAGAGCVAWGPWAVAYYAGRCRKSGDPGQVVLDEWAGQWLALIALPMVTPGRMLTVMAIQFFLFRLFDVIKPPPGRRLEKLPGGWGILLDDLVAGVYANVVGQLILRWLLPA